MLFAMSYRFGVKGANNVHGLHKECKNHQPLPVAGAEIADNDDYTATTYNVLIFTVDYCQTSHISKLANYY